MRIQMRTLYQLWKGANIVALKRLATDSKGSLLLETVIAVLVFTLVGAATLSGLSITQIAGALIEEQSAAENIGRMSRAARRCTTAAEELCTTGTMRKD